MWHSLIYMCLLSIGMIHSEFLSHGREWSTTQACFLRVIDTVLSPKICHIPLKKINISSYVYCCSWIAAVYGTEGGISRDFYLQLPVSFTSLISSSDMTVGGSNNWICWM